MIAKKILILGGYGNVGSCVGQLLIEQTKDTLILLAGRDLERAVEQADFFNDYYKTDRVVARQIDAASKERLTRAFQNVQVVVVAFPAADCIQNVLEAALETDTDCFDIQNTPNPLKLRILESLRPIIEKSGCCFVTHGGFHPGISAALVRYVDNKLCHQIHSTNVYIATDRECSATHASEEENENVASVRRTFQLMNRYRPWIFSDGQWQQQGGTSLLRSTATTKEFDFGSDIGKLDCHTSLALKDEMEGLPEIIPTLKDMGLMVAHPESNYCAGNSWMASALFRKYSSSQSGSTVVLQGSGTIATMTTHPSKKSEEESMRFRLCLHHNDAYYMTAACATACLIQLLDETGRKQCKPGLYRQGAWVDPRWYFLSLQRMGIEMTESFVTL